MSQSEPRTPRAPRRRRRLTPRRHSRQRQQRRSRSPHRHQSCRHQRFRCLHRLRSRRLRSRRPPTQRLRSRRLRNQRRRKRRIRRNVTRTIRGRVYRLPATWTAKAEVVMVPPMSGGRSTLSARTFTVLTVTVTGSAASHSCWTFLLIRESVGQIVAEAWGPSGPSGRWRVVVTSTTVREQHIALKAVICGTEGYITGKVGTGRP